MAGNMFNMMKKAASMQKQMKAIQKELARSTVEAVRGDVTVVASGDMTVKKVTLSGEAVNAANLGKLEKDIAGAVNAALEEAKKKAGGQMSKMAGGVGGLSELLGGM